MGTSSLESFDENLLIAVPFSEVLGDAEVPNNENVKWSYYYNK